jgi:hypothetical protein
MEDVLEILKKAEEQGLCETRFEFGESKGTMKIIWNTDKLTELYGAEFVKKLMKKLMKGKEN